jgi:hypothetical protein
MWLVTVSDAPGASFRDEQFRLVKTDSRLLTLENVKKIIFSIKAQAKISNSSNLCPELLTRLERLL